MMLRTIVKVVLLSCALMVAGCKRADGDSKKSPAKGASGAVVGEVEVVWGSNSKCDNQQVNDFVARAVGYSAQGDYDEYRLLWSIDHRPTSRKRFDQLRRAMTRIEVRTVKRVRFRLADGSIREEDGPAYVFHAFIEMSEQAKQRSEHRVDDRDLVLMIISQDDGWHFSPAPDFVKDALLAGSANGQTESQPITLPAGPPHNANSSD